MGLEPLQKCPECGAAWYNGKTCQDHFHQMLYWENENPAYGVVHHLMVLCYHLQHPSLYSPEGLRYSKQLLADFLVHNATTMEVRKNRRGAVDSSRRTWKIKGTAASHGEYDHPVQWSMTASKVIEAGAENYCDRVRTWAQAIFDDLKASGNFSSE